MTAIVRPFYEGMADSTWDIKSLQTENAFSRLSELFEIGRRVVGDMEKRYNRLADDDILRYRHLWEKQVYSPTFVEASLGLMDDFLHDVEEEYKELDELRDTVEFLKEHGKDFPFTTAKKSALIGMTLTQFLLLIDTISKGIKTGTIAQDTGTLLIVSFYFSLICAICELMKKE